MLRRRRTLAVLALVAAVAGGVIAGARAQVAGNATATVILDGAPLQTGTREVSPVPALGLLLPPGASAGQFGASLDARPLTVAAGAGRTARLGVGRLAQGSHHSLRVWRASIGPAKVGEVEVDFDVVAPLQLAASWLVSQGQTTVQVTASRELKDIAPVEAALSAGGASVRHDEQGVEGRWPAGRDARFTIAAGLAATTGAYLPEPFSAAAGTPARLPESRVDLSEAVVPVPGDLKLRAYYVPGPAARADLALHLRQVAILSPAFYAARGDGTLVRSVDDSALGMATRAGVRVEPLVSNQDFSADTARQLFGSPTAAQALAEALVAEARHRGYGGYQLDFEGLSFTDRDALTRFSGGLGATLKKAGLDYSTAVVPNKQPDAGALGGLFGHSSVYDYPGMSRDAASMTFMAYDQHTSSTEPGPVAGLDWVQRVLTASVPGVDRRKVYLGVPLYYRDWPLRGSPTAGGYDELLANAAAHDGTVSWDFASASPFVRYSAPGEEHVSWFENEASLSAKLNVARRMGFAGVAAWRLGFEDPAWWDLWP